MKVLLLTSISPIDSYEVVTRAMNRFNETVNLIPLPYFADVSCRTYDQDYIPAYFSILKATRKPDMHRKLFKGRNVLVIGNTYKNEKFDMIIACQDSKEEVFDKYIEMIKTDEDWKEFRELVDIDNMYTLEDAEFILPTAHHAILFLEGVFEKNGVK